MFLAKLARTLEMSVPGMGYSVERGEKLTQSNNFLRAALLSHYF